MLVGSAAIYVSHQKETSQAFESHLPLSSSFCKELYQSPKYTVLQKCAYVPSQTSNFVHGHKCNHIRFNGAVKHMICISLPTLHVVRMCRQHKIYQKLICSPATSFWCSLRLLKLQHTQWRWDALRSSEPLWQMLPHYVVLVYQNDETAPL